MAVEKPRGPGEKERVKLDSAAAHLLEECRMVLPGIQALFGFQLIAVFNDGFAEKLSSGEQRLHFAALVLVALATGLVMAPAAIHRMTSQRERGSTEVTSPRSRVVPTISMRPSDRSNAVSTT